MPLEDSKSLNRCKILAYNPETPGITKAFISGRGQYVDYGSFQIKKSGENKNDPGMDSYECYTASSGDTMNPTFPFHEACYRVLARHMGYQDPEEINKDILHEVMCEYSEDCLSNLELDFGGLVVQQFWNCTPGEEVCSSELTPRDVIIDSISILCTVRIQISDYCRVFLAYCL